MKIDDYGPPKGPSPEGPCDPWGSSGGCQDPVLAWVRPAPRKLPNRSSSLRCTHHLRTAASLYIDEHWDPNTVYFTTGRWTVGREPCHCRRELSRTWHTDGGPGGPTTFFALPSSPLDGGAEHVMSARRTSACRKPENSSSPVTIWPTHTRVPSRQSADSGSCGAEGARRLLLGGVSCGSCLPVHLRGAGKVAEIRGHQHHDVFHGTLDESRVISYLSL
jgi:hypothetical protein